MQVISISKIGLLGILIFFLAKCTATEKMPIPEKNRDPIRGIWLTNIDSEALFSKEGIEAAVMRCKQVGINSIFTVVWNRSYTLYPSSIMEDRFGTSIDPAFSGRDPLKELIEIAHDQGIKVHAWFEFGFSCSYEEPDGGRIIRQHPEWAAINQTGQIVSKNGFQWMNAFDPEVQSFLLDLLKEVVSNYDVDGIQGDDRLPALPSEGGYDAITSAKFERDMGYLPPTNYKDSIWVDWRARQLNQWMNKVHTEIKSIRPDVLISMAPSIYPWSKEEYLQDWPEWVRQGWVDFVCPQIYRYDLEKYQLELSKMLTHQIPDSLSNRVYPGILLKVGDYIADSLFLKEMIVANREAGLKGEVFFFYEGLNKRPTFFNRLYTTKD